MTLVELLVILAVSAALAGAAAFGLSRFGSRNRIRAEADKVVDTLWDLRSRATAGMRNPCLDFPAPDSLRWYSDSSATPDGFGPGDRLLGSYRFRGGVRVLAIAGGQGATHAVCFQSRGLMGSAAAALLLTLGKQAGNPDNKRVRLLPSTGTAKVL
jgi:hypothetical protein